MKKLLSILSIALLSLVTMTSCEKSPTELIVGNWELTQMTLSGQGMTIDVDPAEAGIALTVSFKTNGSYTITSSSEDGAESESGTYVYNETSSIITLTTEGYSYSLTVGSISEEELVITQNEEGTTISMYLTRK